jgi:hypothetical protein
VRRDNEEGSHPQASLFSSAGPRSAAPDPCSSLSLSLPPIARSSCTAALIHYSSSVHAFIRMQREFDLSLTSAGAASR